MELSVIGDEEMLQIDQNIGYVRDEAEYRDALIEQVRNEIANMDAAEKLEHILGSEKIYDIQRDMGHIERREYYMSVLRKLVGKEMKSKIFLMSCYRKLENGQREYTMCACSDSNGELKPYLFSAKANRFLGVELEDLINMERQGLVIGKTPKEPGVGIVKKYMKTALKKQKALKQQEKIDAIAKQEETGVVAQQVKADTVAQQEESGVVAQQAEEDTVAQQAKADTVAKQDKLGEER
jgi:hypothetical protein